MYTLRVKIFVTFRVKIKEFYIKRHDQLYEKRQHERSGFDSANMSFQVCGSLELVVGRAMMSL